MPYIPIPQRQNYDDRINDLACDLIRCGSKVGDLVYVFTRLLYLVIRPQRFEDFNKILGICESTKLEYYRQQTAPYEDRKKEQNGDAYV